MKPKGFGCTDGTCKVSEFLECIKFKGHEAKLPRGFISPKPGLSISKLFKNWYEVDDPLDLIVDEAYVDKLNMFYNGEGILLGDPVSNKNFTLEEWNKTFPSDYKYNGILLLGIKMHSKRKGVYTP